MKRIIIENIRILLVAIILSLGMSVTYAWTGPQSAPPPTGTNIPAPINVSAIGQVKEGNLLITNDAGSAYGLIVANGNVGVGTASPVKKLEIAGGIKIGNDTDPCNSGKAGTIRWNGSVFQGCNGGGAWISF